MLSGPAGTGVAERLGRAHEALDKPSDQAGVPESSKNGAPELSELLIIKLVHEKSAAMNAVEARMGLCSRTIQSYFR